MMLTKNYAKHKLFHNNSLNCHSMFSEAIYLINKTHKLSIVTTHVIREY